MARFELKLPQMGESVAEATLTAWLKEVGDTIEQEEGVLEIATDKVDTEVPSEVSGILVEKLFEVDQVVQVGAVIAVIETAGEMPPLAKSQETVVAENTVTDDVNHSVQKTEEMDVEIAAEVPYIPTASVAVTPGANDKRFYSPLVKNIAKQEGLSLLDLAQITGSGSEGRVTKNDILLFVASRKTVAPGAAVQSAINHEDNAISREPKTASVESATVFGEPKTASAQPSIPSGVGNVASEVVEMSRMGKLIAQHMVSSVQTSAHVQSFIEVDVTKIVAWRNKVKDVFIQREGEKFTFTPIFMEAVAVALKKYPMINISLEGDRIIKHKHIHIGMAAALPDGNLIVPVIKHADQLNITGMAKVVNDLATRARDNKLKPDEIKGGTYTVTNVGSFGSVFGTPIINQPQVGILALGAIRKVPSVIETNEGDFIGIRSKMFLSHSYDHRVVNGALGGMFIKTIAEYLEAWDLNRAV